MPLNCDFSVVDIVSDYNLFSDYARGQTIVKTLSPLNDNDLLNATLEHCTLLNETEEGFTFSCMEYNPWFASLTLAFIYLPSLNVIATLYGPLKAGLLGIVWGVVMFGLSFTDSWHVIMERVLVFLGGGMFFLGLIMVAQSFKSLSVLRSLFSLSDFLISGFLFPLLLPLSPLIFICLKLISLLKPNNKLLKAQSKTGSRGESILESAPQFALQCYIVLLSLSPTWSQWFSLITSLLSLCPANIEYYVSACLEEKKRKKKSEEFVITLKFKMHCSKPQEVPEFKSENKSIVHISNDTLEEIFQKSSIELQCDGLNSMELIAFQQEPADTFGPMSFLKNIAVFLPISLFRILAVSILCVLFNGFAAVIIEGYMLVLYVCLEITDRGYNLRGEKDEERQFDECYFMSWLTMTNLGRGKTAALFRMVSTLFWIMAHTVTLTVILVICNTDPSSGDDYNWSELALVQDLTILNTLLISTISLGWLSLVADVITAYVRCH